MITFEETAMKKYKVTLTKPETELLEEITRKGKRE
jgi:hypothetical protein